MKFSPSAMQYECSLLSAHKPGDVVVFDTAYFFNPQAIPHSKAMTIEFVTMNFTRSNGEVHKHEFTEENFEYHVALYNSEGFAYFRGRYPAGALKKP